MQGPTIATMPAHTASGNSGHRAKMSDKEGSPAMHWPSTASPGTGSRNLIQTETCVNSGTAYQTVARVKSYRGFESPFPTDWTPEAAGDRQNPAVSGVCVSKADAPPSAGFRQQSPGTARPRP